MNRHLPLPSILTKLSTKPSIMPPSQLAVPMIPPPPPSAWNYDYLRSLNNGFDKKEYRKELEELKGEVKGLITENHTNPSATLELIDAVQQLGLQYHFEAEIAQALEEIHRRPNQDPQFPSDLYVTALRFRLLRQHGYHVPQDVFKSFLNEAGSFRESLCEEVESLISLYEASFLGLKGETIIDKAMEFSLTCLKKAAFVDENKLPVRLVKKINRALDMPMHWRHTRLEVKWFVDIYQKEPNMNPTLLKMAKLDFNLVQSIHMQEIRELARWWVELDMIKMSTTRDLFMEIFLCSSLISFEPQFGTFRVMNSKLAPMLTCMDDVYDTYGMLDELELLTDIIDRWDITDIHKLPHYIRTYFLALYNTMDEVAHKAMTQRGIDIGPYLRKEFADNCKAYLVEAKWHHNGLKPSTLKEYLDTTVPNIGAFFMLLCCFMFKSDSLTTEALESISRIPRIMHCSALISRLVNDLATSLYGDEGTDDFKSVECYINETGTSKENARNHIKEIVHETWKSLNKEILYQQSIPSYFANACLNNARAFNFFYSHGDGHDGFRGALKDIMHSLFMEPIP